MVVRPLKREDLPRVEEIKHRFLSKWTDSDEWLWKDGTGTCLKLVAEENGEVVAVMKGLMVVELGLMIDPSFGTPETRLQSAVALADAAAAALRAQGVPEIHAPIMPRFAGLARRAERKFGWIRDRRIRLVKDLR